MIVATYILLTYLCSYEHRHAQQDYSLMHLTECFAKAFRDSESSFLRDAYVKATPTHPWVTFDPCPSLRARTILVNAVGHKRVIVPWNGASRCSLFRAVRISLPITRGRPGRVRSPGARQNCSYLQSGEVILSVV